MVWWTLRQLKSDDWQTAERAALQLGTEKEARAVEPLMAALQSPHEKVRYAAAWALGQIEDRRAVEALIDAFRRKPAEAYVRALLELGDQQIIGILIDALIHEDLSLRQLAAQTLDQVSANWTESPAARAAVPRFLEALRTQGLEVKEAALEVLEKLHERHTADTLIQVMENDVDSAGWAARALDKIEPGWVKLSAAKAAVPGLLAVLNGQGFERELAAMTLAEIGDPRAVKPLIEALQDRNRDLRNVAARTLGILGDRTAIGPLLAASLDGFLDPWVVQQGLNGIEPKWANSEEARALIPTLLSKLIDREINSRQHAESTISTIDPSWPVSAAARDAVPMFERQLENPDKDVREAATRILALIRGS